MKMYVIRDAITGKYWSRIMLLENDEHAKRIFTEAAISEEGEISKSPEDYTLYRVGVYDDSAGIPVGHDPERVITANEAINSYLTKQARIEALHKQIDLIKSNGDANAISDEEGVREST